MFYHPACEVLKRDDQKCKFHQALMVKASFYCLVALKRKLFILFAYLFTLSRLKYAILRSVLR